MRLNLKTCVKHNKFRTIRIIDEQKAIYEEPFNKYGESPSEIIRISSYMVCRISTYSPHSFRIGFSRYGCSSTRVNQSASNESLILLSRSIPSASFFLSFSMTSGLALATNFSLSSFFLID